MMFYHAYPNGFKGRTLDGTVLNIPAPVPERPHLNPVEIRRTIVELQVSKRSFALSAHDPSSPVSVRKTPAVQSQCNPTEPSDCPISGEGECETASHADTGTAPCASSQKS